MKRRFVGATLVAAVAAAVSGCSYSGTAADLNVGDCLDLPDSQTVYTVDTLSCNEEHEAEIFYTFTNEDSDTYPERTTLQNAAEEACIEHFKDYVGTSYLASSLDVQWFLPSEESWATGDRETACVAFPLDGSTLTSTIRHSNL